MSRCRKCGAPVTWTLTSSGRYRIAHCTDDHPCQGCLQGRPCDGTPRSVYVHEHEGNAVFHTCHFDTCEVHDGT